MENAQLQQREMDIRHWQSRLAIALADAAEAASKRGATLTAHHWDKAREAVLRLDGKAIAEAQLMYEADHPVIAEG